MILPHLSRGGDSVHSSRCSQTLKCCHLDGIAIVGSVRGGRVRERRRATGDRGKSRAELAIWPPREVWPGVPGTSSKTSVPELNVPLPGSLPRVCPVSREEVELQDPKASEAEG